MRPTGTIRPTISPAPPLARGDRAAALKLRVRGSVIAPSDPTYDEARRAWNLTVDYGFNIPPARTPEG